VVKHQLYYLSDTQLATFTGSGIQLRVCVVVVVLLVVVLFLLLLVVRVLLRRAVGAPLLRRLVEAEMLGTTSEPGAINPAQPGGRTT
jgi:hypothetical protein